MARTPKLDMAKAEDIRRRLADGESGKALARRFGVSPALISKVKRGKRWTGERGRVQAPKTRAVRKPKPKPLPVPSDRGEVSMAEAWPMLSPKEWVQDLKDRLSEAGLYNSLDEPVVVLLAGASHDMGALLAEGAPLGRVNAHRRVMLELMRELGMTPKSRAKLAESIASAQADEAQARWRDERKGGY